MAPKTKPEPTPTPTSSAVRRSERDTIRARAHELVGALLECADTAGALKIRAELDTLPQRLFAAIGALEIALLFERRERAEQLQANAQHWRQWADSERAKLATESDPDRRACFEAFVDAIKMKTAYFERRAQDEFEAAGDLAGVNATDPKSWPMRVRNSAASMKQMFHAQIQESISAGRNILRAPRVA